MDAWVDILVGEMLHYKGTKLALFRFKLVDLLLLFCGQLLQSFVFPLNLLYQSIRERGRWYLLCTIVSRTYYRFDDISFRDNELAIKLHCCEGSWHLRLDSLKRCLTLLLYSLLLLYYWGYSIDNFIIFLNWFNSNLKWRWNDWVYESGRIH